MAFSSKGSFTNDELKHRVRKFFAKFVSDVEPDRLSDWLVQENVISIAQWQRIRHENPTEPDRCRALLHHLFDTQHPSAFLVVREALSERNHYLLALIDNQEPECGIHTGTVLQEEGDSKTKKRSKQSLLVENTKENDLLRKEIEIERTEKESLRLANEQLIINAAKEVQVNKTLTEELSIAEANIVRLKQELDNNKIANNVLQTKNDKQKKELDAEKTTNNSLQTNTCKLVEELNMYKATVTTSETNAEKLRKKLDTTKTDYNEKILMIERTHEQQQKTWMEENEQLRRQIQENRRSTDELRYKSDPVLVQTIRTRAEEKGKKWIYGLTILDKELFVVTASNSEVEVYDAMTLSFNRRFNLKELINPLDLRSCNSNKCLYIFDCKAEGQSNEILRVDPNGKLIKKWSTRGDYGHLSVTDESNVILSVYEKNKLNEYSPDGQLLREINLSSDAGIRNPWHAIKLTNGHIMISHGDGDLHRVCIVGEDGKLKKSFGGTRGSTIGQMYYPSYLSVDGNGFVMVVDQLNHRILLLDRDLEFKREILSKDGIHGIRYPARILLDEANGRLFVANNDPNNRRILIFDFK